MNLGDRVRWSKRAGRYYFWDEPQPSGVDPDAALDDGPRVSSKDGIPESERAALIDQLTVDEECWALDGCNHNHGRCGIHIWDENGEGVIVGKTHREVYHRLTDDNGEYMGMSMQSGPRTNFWEVKTALRSRRIIVPLDAIERIDS